MATMMTLRSKNQRNVILGKNITDSFITTRAAASKTQRTNGRPKLVEISNKTSKIPVATAASKRTIITSNRNSKDQHANSHPAELQTNHTQTSKMAPEAATNTTSSSRARKLGNQNEVIHASLVF